MISNATKVWIFFLITSMLFLIIGYNLIGRFGLVTGFILAFLFNALIFFFGESRLADSFSLIPLQGQDAWGISQILHHLCSKLKVAIPQIYLVESETPTAFCLGYTERSSAICLTTSLVEMLNAKELESVIAHQLCHHLAINNFLFGVTSILTNSLVGLGQALDRLPFINFFQKWHIFERLLTPIGWLLLKFSVNQQSFLESDITASKIIADRRNLAEVLWRLNGAAVCRPLKIPSCTSHLFILNPEGISKKKLFFKTHPSIQVRLQNLIGYYPI